MTFEQLLNLLPNGLHDAELSRLSVDYEKGAVSVVIDIDVSDANAPTVVESSRRATIMFEGVQFVMLEPPGATQKVIARSMQVAFLCVGSSCLSPTALFASLPGTSFSSGQSRREPKRVARTCKGWHCGPCQ